MGANHDKASVRLKTSPPQEDDSASSRDARSRLRKACDSCSIRKVKCDEGGPPCQACASLDIPCTFDRPSRRRGPPNRHAEVMRRKKLDALVNGQSAQHQGLSSTAVREISGESICSLSVLEALIDDYFYFLHPLVPVPHEPSFRESFRNREDKTDATYLALLASMIACLASAYPRRVRDRLKAFQEHRRYPTMIKFMEACHQIASEARGLGFVEKNHTVYDATTSYLLGVACAYTYKWTQTKLYWNECISILRNLGIRSSQRGRMDEINFTHHQAGFVEATENFIVREMGRRTFWLMFIASRIVLQLGGSGQDAFIAPETLASPYPPLPLEVDDGCIFSDRILPQPAGILSLMVGWNASIRIHRSHEPLAVLDMTYGKNGPVQWAQQVEFIRGAIDSCRRTIEQLPRDLKLSDKPLQHTNEPFDYPGEIRFGHGETHNGTTFNQPSRYDRRKTQLEIQKTYIYVSQLSTRFHMIEKLALSVDASNTGQNLNMVLREPSGYDEFSSVPYHSRVPPHERSYPTETNGQMPLRPNQDWIDQEKYSIVMDLLRVVQTIDQRHMEPHGTSLVFKIRMIASSLLQGPIMSNGSPLDQQANQYLGTFLDILMKLERTGPTEHTERSSSHSSPTMGSESDFSAKHSDHDFEDEEAELRHWTDLREHQARFIRTGSFFE